MHFMFCSCSRCWGSKVTASAPDWLPRGRCLPFRDVFPRKEDDVDVHVRDEYEHVFGHFLCRAAPLATENHVAQEAEEGINEVRC